MNSCSEQFARVAKEAREDREFPPFKTMMLAQFSSLAERAGRFIARMCDRDRGIVLENALTLAWTLRDEFDPTTIDLVHYWDECLQGAIHMQRYWFVRGFDGWHRASSETICSIFGLPALLSEDV